MIELPSGERAWEYENGFYLTCDITRISKVIAQWELYKMVQDIPGAIVECGVFKGASFSRFAMFRQLIGNPFSKKLIGFDTFGKYPETNFVEDKPFRQRFAQDAGAQSISEGELMGVLSRKGCERNVELVKGDIRETVPEYIKQNPQLKISLLNLDTDVYEPAVTILNHLYPRIVKGGILIVDDYGTFPGETMAVDEYFTTKSIKVKKLAYCMTPCYIVVTGDKKAGK